MGAGIAQGLAAKGRQVVMKDRDEAALGRGASQSISKVFDERVEAPADERGGEAARRWRASTRRPSDGPFRRVDMVIEAVFEDLDVKHQVIREIEAVAPEGPDLRLEHLDDPDRPAGGGVRAAGERGRHALLLAGPQDAAARGDPPPGDLGGGAGDDGGGGRRDGQDDDRGRRRPGLLHQPGAGPVRQRGGVAPTQGASIEQIDRAMRRWGWPVGPLELLDEVGLDIAHHAGAGDRPVLGRAGGAAAGVRAA